MSKSCKTSRKKCLVCGLIRLHQGRNHTKCYSCWAKQKAIRYKALVFNHYGWRCSHCKETDIDTLTLDHINNDGYKHRKKSRRAGISTYLYVINGGFPDYLQTLCASCQLVKVRNQGKLPEYRKDKYK